MNRIAYALAAGFAIVAVSTNAEARFMPYPDKVEEFCAARAVTSGMYVRNILTGDLTRAEMYAATPQGLHYTLDETRDMMELLPHGTIAQRAANVAFAIETLCLKNGR